MRKTNFLNRLLYLNHQRKTQLIMYKAEEEDMLKVIFKIIVKVIVIGTAISVARGGFDSSDTTSYTPSYENTVIEEPVVSVPRSSEDSIAVGIDMLEESLIYYESDLLNYIGDPIAVEGNVYYFHIQTLFEKSGIMEVEVKDGRVARTTWTYKFVDVVDDSEVFYNDIVAMKDRMPYTNISVNRDYDTGYPRVSVTVWNDMI